MKSMTSTNATVGRDRIGRALATQLRKSPGLNAPDLVWQLALIGLAVSRTEVNSVLYGDSRFRNDGSTPPRWCLTGRLAPTKPAGGTTTAARGRAAPPSAWSLRLYGWQEDALAAWKAQGSRGVIEAVTGTGKTMVGIAAAAETLHAGEKVCVLVPTRELLDQWTEKLRHHLPAGTRIGRLGDGSRDMLLHFDVLVAIVNSARTTDVRATQGHGLLIADECHRYGSEVNKQALDPRFSRRLGLSATYARSDDGHLEWLDPYFGGTCFQLGYRLAIADEVTAHFNVAFVGCRFTDGEATEYAEVSSTAAKSRQLLVQQHGVPAEPFGEFMRAVTQMAEGGSEATWPARRYLAAFQRRKQLLAETPAKAGALALLTHAVRGAERTIVFTQTIAASEGAAAQLRASRLNVEAVHSRVDTVGRKNILKRFGTGQTQVLVAPQVLDEGIDVPAADLAIIVAASRTRRQMIQRMGRVLRRKPDNRLARFAVLYVEGTSEDPGYGAHEDFLDEITEVAEGVRVFPAGADSASISAFLNTTKAAVTPPGPRWAGEPARAPRAPGKTTSKPR